MPETIAILDGRRVQDQDLALHPDSQAGRYALAIFEGVRGYVQRGTGRVALFALDAHLDRFKRSLSGIQLPAPDRAAITGALADLLDANRIDTDCYVRLLAASTTRANMESSAAVSWSASVRPMGRSKWTTGPDRLRVSISRWQKPTDAMFPQAIKCIANYAGPRLAFLEARRDGFDTAVLTTPAGDLAEAPTANVFLVIDDELATPPADAGILPGITRRTLLTLGADLGLRVSERRLIRADASRAREAFLCGTGIELSPIGNLDGRALDDANPVTRALIDRYFELVRGQGA